MTQFLLDTNIVAFLFRGKYNVKEKLLAIGKDHCCISIITYAELYYGCEASHHFEKNYQALKEFCKHIEIVGINDAIPFYAKEKNELRKKGISIDDFDLLIGTTAVAHGMTLVTDNTKHLERIENIKLENWIDR